ncbi:putative serine/threonine-protein kinase PBL28 [Tasmannia lanceolata]|uniref:putative serine/threonine-protein kinase PBL28 n=1 Tax=Tasmannia lanceolata TaxID=3420 RepID=UPI0040629AA2
MCWLWWLQLPLLIIILLSAPNTLKAMSCSKKQKIYAKPLLSFKSAVGNPQQLSSWEGKYPCLRPWTGVSCCCRSTDWTIISLLHGNNAPCSQSGIFNLPACDSTFSPSPTLAPLQVVDAVKSRKASEAATTAGDLGGPTFTPLQATDAGKPRKKRMMAIIVGGVSATVIVATVVVVVYFCLMRAKRLARRASETGSSDPSSQVEWARGRGPLHAEALSPFETQSLRQLTVAELVHATSNFSQCNVIGEGGFGLVYKGLLHDGSIVAIKRHLCNPSHLFVQEVENIGRVRHKHIVKLIGYCQESHQQLLIYDYLPNGNVGSHLYDADGLPIGKLDIRQRLSIALGAAKGLDYLHGLMPPLLHMHFKTSNVLVDENYTAKVADFGLSKLLIGVYRAGTSSGTDYYFLDPELSMSNGFPERSDVYSFGVFLLELVSGREAVNRNRSETKHNLVEQAKSTNDLDGFLDKTIANVGVAMQRLMELALQCIETGPRRPTMKQVVRELEVIQEAEIGSQHNTGTSEDIGVVTLGSELFK